MSDHHLIDNFSNISVQELSLVPVSQSNIDRTTVLNSPGSSATEVFGPVSFSRTSQILWKSYLHKQKENINLVVETKTVEKEPEHKKLMDQFIVPLEIFSEALEISRANRALFMQSLMLSTLQSSQKMKNS